KTDRAAHQLSQPARDRQPKAGAAEASRRGRLRLRKRLEEAFAGVFGDTDASVDDIKANLAPPRCLIDGAHGHADFALLGELHRVRHEIEEHLAQTSGIANECCWQLWINVAEELDALAFGPLRHKYHCVFDHGRRVELDALEIEPTGLDL